MTSPLLDITNLELQFQTTTGVNKVLHGVDLIIYPGQRVALVGESGSGKSVIARLILGLLQGQKGVISNGRINFNGENLQTLSAAKRESYRGREMSMIFQDPSSSLNPVYRISVQFHEILRRREPDISIVAAHRKAMALLTDVSIQDPQRILDSYPFQLSGGLNQRVMIAMALANRPELLIADEPGTALDVSVQAQTLALMRELVVESRTSVLFISHNLGVVREFADRVYVIYQGRIVESGTTRQIFINPQHAYTQALLAAVPRLNGGGLPDINDDIHLFDTPAFHHNSPVMQS